MSQQPNRMISCIGVRDGGGQGRQLCRHTFGQRVDIIRAKHNTCLNNTNLGSVTAANGKNSATTPPPNRARKISATTSPTEYGSRKISATTPPTESIRAKLGLPPPKWMLARTPMIACQINKCVISAYMKKRPETEIVEIKSGLVGA